MSSRSPDFVLKAMRKSDSAKGTKLGAAWKNADGSISIVLDVCVVLDSNPDIVLRLWPNTKYASGAAAAPGPSGATASKSGGAEDDEPF